MKILRLAALSALLTLPLLGAPASAAAEPTGPGLVARYNFDGGTSEGKINDLSGRGAALTLRGSNNGQVSILTEGAGRFAAFPAICAAAVSNCAKALLETPDRPDLDPGTRNFKWAASVRLTAGQLSGNANVMQKGVANAESQWKMQVTSKTGRAQCVLVARGSAQTFTATSARPVADGSWHRVACERANGSLAVAVDGVTTGRVTVPATVGVDNAMPMRVGGPNLAGSGDMYHGQIDDIYIQLG
ncbi:LamG-like jellyroll fold domain-containing protein [Actinoplanes derwentensis]|uniref:Concanavalin A-like lectin/glucanases superfamily protein n=1 Tax=Actinoplanes derwentensis TaxID=113562 RepID=A0A1H1PXD3_9ACTN|nr:LamG-like jellyroll fold domain-containing protein [Actinoplanes derwentensis]SDS15838.1 Concanavalin A-like lectin/glucanases superfamily protein [Actinoplanes derwentensis]